MRTKELIEFLDRINLMTDCYDNEVYGEIIERLRQFDDLKELVTDMVDPLIEAFEFLLNVENFQEESEE